MPVRDRDRDRDRDSDILRANILFTEGKYGEAAVLFAAGAREGHTRAIFNYAYCLQYGYGVDADPGRAFRLYTHLRYEEEGDAAYNAGAMLVTGRGVACDPGAGYAFMREAADLGCIEAQLYVAMVHLTGCVGEPDVISVRRIPFHRPDTPDAALLLEPVGAYDDTLADRRFEVVEADENEAIRYIRMAAKNRGDYVGTGVGDAEFLLAKCADEGFGRMMDHDKAVELTVRAAEHGSYAAFAKLKTLPPYTVEAARRRLKMKTRSGYLIGDGEDED